MWAEAGQAFGTLGTDDDPCHANRTDDTNVHSDQHLTAFLMQRHKSWRSYQEDANVNLTTQYNDQHSRLAGGYGAFGSTDQGAIAQGDNFLARSLDDREHFAVARLHQRRQLLVVGLPVLIPKKLGSNALQGSQIR